MRRRGTRSKIVPSAGCRERERAPHRHRRRRRESSDLSERQQRRKRRREDVIPRKAGEVDEAKVRKELELLERKEQELLSELRVNAMEIKDRRVELGEDHYDYYTDYEYEPPKSLWEWEVKEYYDHFVKDVEEAVQYFKFMDYLLECDFLKHDSCPELLFSSGKLPLNQFPLLEKYLIISALEDFIEVKEMQFCQERLLQCRIYVSTCKFIKCDSDPLKIALILMDEFPDLTCTGLEAIIEAYLVDFNHAQRGTEKQQEEFPSNYVKKSEECYLNYLEGLKMRCYPHKFQDPHVIRNIVYEYRAKNYVVDLKAEFLKYMFPYDDGQISSLLATCASETSAPKLLHVGQDQGTILGTKKGCSTSVDRGHTVGSLVPT